MTKCGNDILEEEGFNPRLSLPRGEALRDGVDVLRVEAVSIHASRCREAKRGAGCSRSSCRRFQSTPLVAERRSFPRRTSRNLVQCFNPRLSLPRGEARPQRPFHDRLTRFNPRLSLPRGEAQVTGVRRRTFDVSIHASRCREAKRHPQSSWHRDKSGFNPRLSLPRGEALNLPWIELDKAVSIHASRCREAKPFTA